MSRVEYSTGSDGDHYWHCKDDNNKIVCQGEGYETAAGAHEGFLNAVSAMVEASLELVPGAPERLREAPEPPDMAA